MKTKVWLGLLILIIPFFTVSGQDDIYKPDAPILLLADVIPGTDSLILKWALSDSADVQYYVVYTNKGIGWIPVDTSFSATTDAFTIAMPAVLSGPVPVCVVAVDSSKNNSPLSNNHTTNFISVQFDSCGLEMELSWTGYRGWEGKDYAYKVWKQYRPGVPESVANLDSASRQYDAPVERDQNVCFWIEAIQPDGSSVRSNSICRSTTVPRAPDWINADYATVDSAGKVNLSFHIDPQAGKVQYALYRTSLYESTWERIALIDSAVSHEIQYSDPPPDAGSAWTYKLASVNACLDPQTYSNAASTIALSSQLENGKIILHWNTPCCWRAGVESYTVYRMPESSATVAVATNGPADTSFYEFPADIAGHALKGQICYRIRAVENTGNPYGISGTSYSASSCINIQSHYRVPNAFTPDGNGINDTFAPVFDFIPQSYLFIIFDVAGKKIFQTSDPAEPWNGRDLSDKPVAPGVYVWFLQYTGYGEHPVQDRGAVTVIYP